MSAKYTDCCHWLGRPVPYNCNSWFHHKLWGTVQANRPAIKLMIYYGTNLIDEKSTDDVISKLQELSDLNEMTLKKYEDLENNFNKMKQITDMDLL